MVRPDGEHQRGTAQLGGSSALALKSSKVVPGGRGRVSCLRDTSCGALDIARGKPVPFFCDTPDIFTLRHVSISVEVLVRSASCPKTGVTSFASTCRKLSRSGQRLSDRSARRLADRAKALADPTRLTLAAALAETDELCVCDLAWVAERSENLVSHHLRALRTAGIVSSRREGKMVMYAVTDAGRTLLAAVNADVELAR